MQINQFLTNETETLKFGASCAKWFRTPCIVYLDGNLGAGKTTFVRGFLRGLDYTGVVKSPTYAIVETYQLSQQTIHHFDLYRFTSPEEWEDAGLGDFIENSICLIEWAKQGGDYVPPADFVISLVPEKDGRRITITSQNQNAQKEMQQWQI